MTPRDGDRIEFRRDSQDRAEQNVWSESANLISLKLGIGDTVNSSHSSWSAMALRMRLGWTIRPRETQVEEFYRQTTGFLGRSDV